jgi:hypothetical protein
MKAASWLNAKCQMLSAFLISNHPFLTNIVHHDSGIPECPASTATIFENWELAACPACPGEPWGASWADKYLPQDKGSINLGRRDYLLPPHPPRSRESEES